ncbi:MAG: hypothetical protein ABIN58_11475 [candidate division WOR-3 bacterium]
MRAVLKSRFLSAGFSYGNVHMKQREVSSGSIALHQLLGLSGNTGSLVEGETGYLNHLTIYDLNYGRNRYLSDVLGLGDSGSFLKADGTAWSWPHNPSRRFYDPADVYADWFRR